MYGKINNEPNKHPENLFADELSFNGFIDAISFPNSNV
jgi:hypothetical protein